MLDLIITLSIFDQFSAQALFSWFVEHANYLFVFVFMVIESSFIPFPSEVVVPPAVYLAMTGSDMDAWIVVALATAGAIVGALINYVLALWLGRPIVYAFANSRVGHMLLIDEAKVVKAEQYFAKHGSISTFIGRLIPAVRQLISIPAGIARMNIGKFIFFTGLGAFIWNCILGLLGYMLSQSVSRDQLFAAIEKYNGYLTIAGLALFAVCVAFIIYKGLKREPKAE